MTFTFAPPIQMVSKTFGEMLYLPESESLAEFPSPESLKRKIMISTKPPKEYLESQDSTLEIEQVRQRDSLLYSYANCTRSSSLLLSLSFFLTFFLVQVLLQASAI